MVLRYVLGSFNDEFIKDDIYNKGVSKRNSWDGLNLKLMI